MIRIILALLLVFGLTSCGENSKQPEYPLNFAGKIDVTYNSTEFLVDAVYSYGNMHLTVIEPESLLGVGFKFDCDGIMVSKGSLELAYDSVTLEALCPFSYVFDALENLNSTEPEFSVQGQYFCADFSADGKRYEVFLDKNSCKPLKIKCDGYLYSFFYDN